MTAEEKTHALITQLRAEGITVESYSGRAMWGKYCVGAFVDDEWELTEAMANIQTCVRKHTGQPRRDAMGMGMVIYWPKLAWPSDIEESLEEEEY